MHAFKLSKHYLLYLYSSAGQSDKLLARIHTLEQEKAMLSEQVESAQAMLRSYLEGTQHSWQDSNYEVEVATCFSNDLTDYTFILTLHII